VARRIFSQTDDKLDREDAQKTRLYGAIERLSIIGAETRSQYSKFAEQIAQLPAARRSHVSGGFLVSIGIVSAVLSAVAHPFLNFPSEVTCTLLISGTVLIAISTISESYLRGLLLNQQGARLTEQTQHATEELDRILRALV
jgi:hypothetical protein